jgi:hypothetical protein
MKFLNHQEMCDEMNLQPENAPSTREIIDSWVILGGDPDEVYEMVEGGVMLFDSQEEREIWLKQK